MGYMCTYKADDNVDEQILGDALIAAIDEERFVVECVVAVTLHRHSRDLRGARHCRHVSLWNMQNIKHLLYMFVLQNPSLYKPYSFIEISNTFL